MGSVFCCAKAQEHGELDDDSLEVALGRFMSDFEDEEAESDQKDKDEEAIEFGKSVNVGRPIAEAAGTAPPRAAEPGLLVEENMPSSVAAEPLNADADPDDVLGPLLRVQNRKQGPFTLSLKQPKAGNRYGGFEASCPYHRKNNATACKRFFTVRGPSLAERRSAMHSLLYWCWSAQQHERQWSHVFSAIPQLATLPKAVWLWEEIKALPAPTSRAATDLDLDMLSAASSQSAAAKRSARPKADAKANAKAASKAHSQPLASSKAVGAKPDSQSSKKLMPAKAKASSKSSAGAKPKAKASSASASSGQMAPAGSSSSSSDNSDSSSSSSSS